MKRSITHWTAGTGRASSIDKKHYHRITEFDATVVDGIEEIEDNVVTSDGDYAAHTRNFNTESGGFAMAGMRGATEFPFHPGDHPINEKQFEAHCRMLASFHTEYGIPVTPYTCLTHAEVENRFGIKQNGKWDLTRLPFRPEIVGAGPVGDYLRERVQSYMPQNVLPDESRPVLREGSRGLFVEELQDLLVSTRSFVGAVDGVFGPRTKAAVLSFQSAAGLRMDGVVGPNTWNALMTSEPLSVRSVDEGDLRERGSRTMKAADEGEKASKVGAGAIVGLGALDTALAASEKVSEAAGTLATLRGVMLENWPVLIVIAIGILIYYRGGKIFSAIRGYRVDDAQSGANMGR